MRTAPLLLAGLLLSVAACGAQQPPRTDVVAQPAVTPVCSDTTPHPAAGPASPMVPDHPAAAVVCHYAAGQQHLVKSVQVKDVNGLAAALNSADTVPPPRGVMCPMDNGTVDVILFAYTNRDAVDVTVKPTGCATATNGTAKAYRLSPAVLDKL
jgi:hypothetical protein